MKIEILVRWSELKIEKLTEEEIEQKRIDRIINGEEEDEENEEDSIVFVYDNMVIDSDSIKNYAPLDESNTMIKMDDGEVIVVGLEYKVFKDELEKLTGVRIINICKKIQEEIG